MAPRALKGARQDFVLHELSQRHSQVVADKLNLVVANGNILICANILLARGYAYDGKCSIALP